MRRLPLTGKSSCKSTGELTCELLLLFIGLPLAFFLSPVRIPEMPVLWIATGYAWWQLMRDPSFDRNHLWETASLRDQLAGILSIFLVAAALIWAGVHWFAPDLEWSMVRQHPIIWALLMVLYPVLSVYPQGVLYRAFFLHRYAGLFPRPWMLVLASAVVFSFMHIVFRNPVAVALTFVGGILFAWRSHRTKTFMSSNLEHALYGCWMFTVGLGDYFYHGITKTH